MKEKFQDTVKESYQRVLDVLLVPIKYAQIIRSFLLIANSWKNVVQAIQISKLAQEREMMQEISIWRKHRLLLQEKWGCALHSIV